MRESQTHTAFYLPNSCHVPTERLLVLGGEKRYSWRHGAYRLGTYVMGQNLTLNAGQVGIFGYGSLLLQSSMERTLGHPYKHEPLRSRLRGWRRVWNVSMPNDTFFGKIGNEKFIPKNIVYLNVTPDSKILLNGLIYVLDRDEVATFDQREWIYDRIEITKQLADIEVDGGEVYLYVAKPEWIISAAEVKPKDAGIRETYLEIVEIGISHLGAGFRREYELSTDSHPKHLVFKDLK